MALSPSQDGVHSAHKSNIRHLQPFTGKSKRRNRAEAQ